MFVFFIYIFFDKNFGSYICYIWVCDLFVGEGGRMGGDIYLDFLYYGVVVFGYYEGIILFWGSRGF